MNPGYCTEFFTSLVVKIRIFPPIIKIVKHPTVMGIMKILVKIIDLQVITVKQNLFECEVSSFHT